MTLVPGARKGMFPSRNAIDGGARKFRHVVIVEVDNITIAWPKRSHDRRTPPPAEIVEQDDDEVDGLVKKFKATHLSSYTAACNILQPNTQYTIVGAALKKYSGVHRWHFITKCGLKVREGT